MCIRDSACADVRGNPSEDDLFTELFYTRFYNRLTRPVVDLAQTTHVQLALVLQKIVQVVRTTQPFIPSGSISEMRTGPYR